MHSGDGNAVFQAHQLGQHLGALDHGNVQPARFGHFGIVGRDRGTGDHDFRAGHVFRAMSLESCRAQSDQPLCNGRSFQIRAGNFIAEV